MHITARMAALLSWVIFVTFHLSVITALLAVGWWTQVPPHAITSWAAGLLPAWLQATAVSAWAFLGLSGLAALAVYAKAWHWLLGKLQTAYLFRGMG